MAIQQKSSIKEQNSEIQKILAFFAENETKEFLQEHNIKHIRLAGSYAKGIQTEDSDIDLIFEHDESMPIQGRGSLSAQAFLEEKLNKKVDLLDKQYIHHSIKKNILSSVISLW